MSRFAATCAALALGACAASHQPTPDAGREPVRECNDRWGSCAALGLTGFRCCADAETDDRYCCDADHEVIPDGGVRTWMCGDGPACVDSYCCAAVAELFPDRVERCTDNLRWCEDLGAYPPPEP